MLLWDKNCNMTNRSILTRSWILGSCVKQQCSLFLLFYSFLCMQVLTISTFSSLRPPPLLFHTMSLPWIEYIVIDQVSHRSQNSGFGSFYETWLLNVDSDGSEEFGQNLVITRTDNICSICSSWILSLMYDIESLMSTSNNFSCLTTLPCMCMWRNGESVEKKSSFHFAWLFCPSQTLTDSDTF